MPNSALHDRLAQAVGNRSFRHIGELTRTHPETVRRYMQGQAPSVEFLAALSQSLLLNADWLLTGRGPMSLSDVKSQTLRDARAGELLTAMASTIERLVERVERLELYTQTMEARVSARAAQDTVPRFTKPISEPGNTPEDDRPSSTPGVPIAPAHVTLYPESTREAFPEVKPIRRSGPLAGQDHVAQQAELARQPESADPVEHVEPHLQAARLVADAAARAVQRESDLQDPLAAQLIEPFPAPQHAPAHATRPGKPASS